MCNLVYFHLSMLNNAALVGWILYIWISKKIQNILCHVSKESNPESTYVETKLARHIKNVGDCYFFALLKLSLGVILGIGVGIATIHFLNCLLERAII